MNLPYYEVHWIIGGKKYSRQFKEKEKAVKQYKGFEKKGIPVYWNYRISHAISACAARELGSANSFGKALINLSKK